ncbi:prolyl oligopeptidase family serine peptidase [Actinoallomurus bryophytorum]|uniref:Dipeptidyl aminopeptidase/acylaminoacyl peptidase n=1 Tax=Actinoallomurus bryophytorum TaxID=1490222 RepID=A0A543CJY4_9ACTN|nr:prolyl oligopeptidase family serine peptidase [Actinoallomurus bryophytorum]TQL97418.1 dipeptidyl aminopeptidase/acylaminoacyl peptidase [Actinoallomurus bryophytorum]
MVDEELWKARFRAARVSLPGWAHDAPHRSVYRSNATGTWEIYAWDRETDVRRQVTDRPNGTWMAGVDPTGEWIWWFADTDGDEFGVWRREPFGGGADAAPALDAAYPSGLAVGSSGLAVIGRTTESGSTVHWCATDAEPRVLYSHDEDAYIIDLSEDESLVAINHSEHGDSRHMALRILRPDGSTVADLWDGPGKGLGAIAFSPVAGDQRLLVEHERRGRGEPLIWDPVSGDVREIALDLPGEVGADWYPDASALLVSHSHHARDELYRYDLATGSLERIDTPRGVIGSATARPDGTVEFSWSSSASPPVIRSTSGAVVLTPPGEAAPKSVAVEDAWVTGPGGDVHALVAKPEGAGPFPAVFDVHGGPAAYDDDSFSPDAAAWVDHGFAVVRVNYRGSSGYGSEWRDAIEGRPGLVELEDIKAVRDWAVSSGLADPSRLVLTGGSWGGFITLLGIGTQPGDWSVAIGIVPVADYVAAYEDEMEALQAFDRSLFGGSPADVPERYEASSPITYVDQVTTPVLVMAGENDPRCPIRQIDNYLERLRELGKEHEVYRYDAGHGSLVVEERIRQMAATIDFARKHLDLT